MTNLLSPRRAIAALAATALVGAVAFAADPDSPVDAQRVAAQRGDAQSVDVERIDSLVRQLGDRSFRLRERAERELAELGLPAKEAIAAAASASQDLEIRNRARTLLKVFAAHELERRVSRFLADKSAATDDLPGWQRFASLVGSGRNARRLYAQIYRAEHALIDGVEDSPLTGGDLVLNRANDWRQAMLADRNQDESPPERASAESIAALVFACQHPDVRQVEPALNIVADVILISSEKPFADRREFASQWRRLLTAWVAHDFGAAAPTLYQQVRVACSYNLRVGSEAARRMLADEALPPQFVPYAILGLARLGASDQLPVLDRWLEDRTVAFDAESGEAPLPIEMRDLALFAALHLTGQKSSDYGFSRATPQPTWGYVPNTLAFDSVQAREAAFAKWVAWKASQK